MLAIVVCSDVPPWLYMHVFFAVGLPKERALSTLVPRWTHQSDTVQYEIHEISAFYNGGSITQRLKPSRNPSCRAGNTYRMMKYCTCYAYTRPLPILSVFLPRTLGSAKCVRNNEGKTTPPKELATRKAENPVGREEIDLLLLPWCKFPHIFCL